MTPQRQPHTNSATGALGNIQARTAPGPREFLPHARQPIRKNETTARCDYLSAQQGAWSAEG